MNSSWCNLRYYPGICLDVQENKEELRRGHPVSRLRFMIGIWRIWSWRVTSQTAMLNELKSRKRNAEQVPLVTLLSCSQLVKATRTTHVYINTVSNWRCHSSGGLVAGFPPRLPGFEPTSGHVDLWWTRWQVSPSTPVSPANPHSTDCSTLITISSRAGTIGQFVADVPSGLGLTPPQEVKKN
jgi:hypothetical protein